MRRVPSPTLPGNVMRLPAVQHLLALPTYTKILIANSLIVAVGAVFGTALVSLLEEQAELVGLALFAAAGILVSVLLNSVVVRLALRPMVSLARTAASIRPAEPARRFTPPLSADADTRRLAESLNGMLDRLADDAADLEASRRQLRALASRTLGAQEDERRRIARELHDETAQVLATLLIQISLLREQVGADADPDAGARLDDIEALAQAALTSVRAIAHDLRPSALDDLGLAAAIRWYAGRRLAPAGLVVTVEAEDLRLDPPTETALYRVAQEALTNSLRHAQAESVTVRLTRSGEWVELSVCDDGRGFALDDVLGSGSRERRLGLLGMQERVHLLDGRLEVVASPGRGTRVIARLPAVAPVAPAPQLSEAAAGERER